MSEPPNIELIQLATVTAAKRRRTFALDDIKEFKQHGIKQKSASEINQMSSSDDQTCRPVLACSKIPDPAETLLMNPADEPRRSGRSKKPVKKYNPPVVNDRLTPMGLPKPNRLPKNHQASLEDIYNQTNYHTPQPSRAITTILDENDPKAKGGSIPFSKVKRKRYIVFPTNPLERKPKKRKISRDHGRGRKRKINNSIDHNESDRLLKEKLTKLDKELEDGDD